MSVERVFYCDWRECDSHTRTVDSEPAMGFVTIIEDGQSQHFCSWDCVLKQAAEVPPVEVVGSTD